MKAKLTERFVNSLKPASTPYDVRDTALQGFLVRVQPTGYKSFNVQWDRNRRRKRIGQVGPWTYKRARAEAIKILGKAASGEIEGRTGGNMTLGDFVQKEYAAWAETHQKTAAGTLWRLEHCFGDLYGRRLKELSPWIIEKWRATRIKAGRSPATINRDLATLKSALSKAVAWGHLPEHPLKRVRMSKLDTNAKVRYLSAAEEKRLRGALDRREHRLREARESHNRWRAERGRELLPEVDGFVDHLQPMILLSLNTGLRRGELFNLRWQDVAGRNLTVEGTGTKTGKTRHIPLNKEATEVLRTWRRQAIDKSGLIFPSRDGGTFNNTNKSWRALLTDAGIEKFRWHDMRHHFASRLVMGGIDLNTVRELLGHADLKMTLRYAHLAPEHKAAAVAVLDR